VKEMRVCTKELEENAGLAHSEAVQISALHERVASDPVQIQCMPSRTIPAPLSQTCDVEELSSGIYNHAVFRVLDCKDDDVVTIPKVQVRQFDKCFTVQALMIAVGHRESFR